MPRKLIEEAIKETNINNSVKRWTILDARTNKTYLVSDMHFSDGLKSNVIKLRGQYISFGNTKQWIDGIIK